MNAELPSITASAYACSRADVDGLLIGRGQVYGGGMAIAALAGDLDLRAERRAQGFIPLIPPAQPNKDIPMPNARIVKVFIADADENVPLEKRLLHSGEEKFTDLTDQELFFEVPIKDLLDKHNEFRKTVVDKKKASSAAAVEYLEPIRIRDLKMVVVTVASF